MSTLINQPHSAPLRELFFHPLHEALSNAKNKRACPTFKDGQWVEMNVHRALSKEKTGRGFLQLLNDQSDRVVQTSSYFEGLKSKRRLRLLRELNERIVARLEKDSLGHHDPFAQTLCLNDYHIFAGDGHYLEHATHDRSAYGHGFATGHFFGTNLRSGSLFYLTLSDQHNDRKKEHDTRALKRSGFDLLRRGVRPGKRVLWVWDRAGIDMDFWKKAKNSYGIYFVSRAKENMVLDNYEDIPFDTSDPDNAGVSDYFHTLVGGIGIRCIRYTDPNTGAVYEFVTSLTNVQPGVIAALYFARWRIEKLFDETKCKFEEKKSWASSETAKEAHAQFVCMTHNLSTILERKLEDEYNIEDKRNIRKRARRKGQAKENAEKAGLRLPPIMEKFFDHASQRALQFIRWVRNTLDIHLPLERLLNRLRRNYGISLT